MFEYSSAMKSMILMAGETVLTCIEHHVVVICKCYYIGFAIIKQIS